ncbi:CRISPR associated protein Cas1 [Apibacter mensalis]|uniref:CRISPR associated protein Cas1 n=1 Tax=Apibacter mensalis TaxID=1586267 RepID=A0A0X3ASH6_9FLAO|nr:CRISPR associated protein Cas1 [Apibacter mensalis]
MITRSVYIGTPSYLKLKDEQVYITEPSTGKTKGKIPIEDLGLLMLDHFQITIFHQLIQKMMGNHVVIISCDALHLPHGIMLPLYGHTEYSERIKNQINISVRLKISFGSKRWKIK